MAHELEFVNGKASMAYAGDAPWHGLGRRVSNDLTPEQMLEAAQLNWTTEKVPAYADVAGQKIYVEKDALIRSSDNQVLSFVSGDWNPVQNIEAAVFFNDFVGAGEMNMDTAGSLRNGKIVWFLAKTKESFDLFGGDVVDSYLLFTNYHMYGYSTDIRFTPIRVVCNNTLTLSLNTSAIRSVKVSHRAAFDPDNVKEVLGIAKEKLAVYKETAAFLGSKKVSDENIVEYFTRIFPASSGSKKEISKNAEQAFSLMETQPGANFAEGSFWNMFNTVSYMTDHVIGRSLDTRLASSWYGDRRILKNKALTLAVTMAETA